jgi:GST-like protein
MAYILYGEDGSGSAIIEMALRKLGLGYEVRNVDLSAGEQRSSEYARINPQRKIPALITPEGETLTESPAILLTLDERWPEAGLLPRAGTRERAQALRWLAFVAAEIYPIIEIHDYPERFARDPSAAAATREVAREICRSRWLVVEGAISGDPWLLQTGFSMVDVYIAVVSRWAVGHAWKRQRLPRVEAIAEAIAQRHDVGPVWRRHFA